MWGNKNTINKTSAGRPARDDRQRAGQAKAAPARAAREPAKKLRKLDKAPKAATVWFVIWSQDHHQRWWLAAAGPSKGPDRRRARTGPTGRSLRGLGRIGELHNPGTVKLWESPGRAGGLPIELILTGNQTSAFYADLSNHS